MLRTPGRTLTPRRSCPIRVADHGLDRQARRADGANHCDLFVTEVGLQGPDVVDGGRCGGRRRAAFISPAQESRLDLDQLRRAEHRAAAGADAAVVEPDEHLGVAAGGRSGEHHDPVGGEEPVGQALDLGRRRRRADGSGDLADDVAAGEARGALGQAMRPGEVLVEPLDVGVGQLRRAGAVEARLDGPVVEPEGGGPLLPGVGERVGIDRAVLRPAGGEGGLLAGAGRGVAGLGEHLLDLVAPLAELVDDRLGDAGDIRHAVDDGSPLDAEAAGEEVAEVGLVEVAAGGGVVEERPGVEGAPGVGDGVGEVGDDDVGVQERVAGPAGAVVEGGGDEAEGLDALAPVPGDDDLALVVADDLVDGLPVGLADGGPPLRVGEGPEDADALGRAEGVVEAGAALGRLVRHGVDVYVGTPDPPGEPSGRLRAGLLPFELPGAEEPADEGGRDAELGGCLLGREPLALRADGDVAGLRPGRVDELLAGERVAAVEQGAEVVGVDLAVEAHLGGHRADLPAGGFAVSQVVVLGRGGDLADVVIGAAGAELPDVQHETVPGSRRVRRRRNLQVFEDVVGLGRDGPASVGSA